MPMWLWRCLHSITLSSYTNNLPMKFYAVHVGRKPGIYNTWKECEMQVKSFSGAKYKKFTTLNEAKSFVSFGYKKPNKFNKIPAMTNQFSEPNVTTNNKNQPLKLIKRKASESTSSSKLPKLEGIY